MSLKEEWQLVAHNKHLTPAQGSVALAIARRIDPHTLETKLSFKALYAESVGVGSKETISKALDLLEELGVITRTQPLRGSRTAQLIRWVLECPLDCQSDHSNANKKLKLTRLERENKPAIEPEQEERHAHSLGHDTPTHQDALRKKEIRERETLLSFIEEALETESETAAHLALSEALKDPEQRALIRTRAEQLAIKADNPKPYLKAIAIKSPEKLLPKLPTPQAPPDFSHLPKDIREAQLRKWQRLQELKVS